jgi:flagellar L-ring protein precursor FlgH
MNIAHRATWLLSALALLLAGCQSRPVRDPAFAPVRPEVAAPTVQDNGAIYQPGFEHNWFENVRARHVGDILLVTLVEDTEASHTNSGAVSKSSSTSITNPTILGKPLSFKLPYINNGGHANLGSSLESESDFSGSADNTQNNQFTGSISVSVTEVLPNGYLKVRGEKRISMTGGNEYIRVSGIVRPEDINTDNTVASTKIADATLTYVGDGQNTMATQMGWLAKFFISAILPF